ncbi:MAG: site-specific DNA-methyltransferase, partial [Ammonifex sp.]
REPEMVKAYRDTWTLGVHSYLSYLRDRLLLCKELLADTGTIFVQISDENLHRVRSLLDEIFGVENFINVIVVLKRSPQPDDFLSTVTDYLLWYGKNRQTTKFRNIFKPKEVNNDESTTSDLTSSHYYSSPPFIFQGRTFVPKQRYWSTSIQGLSRIAGSDRIVVSGNSIRYKRYFKDFPVNLIGNNWPDVALSSFGDEKIYTVQTAVKVIERCILMTTDPGDLVLDPTCGSGTTAYVAEQWGRRWITIDVSRVAIAIARQRLLTAKFDYYRLRPTSAEDVQRNPDGPWLTDPEGKMQGTCTLDCKTVPHITLKSIAQNQALDPIFERWEPVLALKLAALNEALANTVTRDLRQKLLLKLHQKIRAEGKRAVTDADERRWKLPEKEWKDWEVPFDTDPDWPEELRKALTDYRQAWRQKMDEVNACISARADQEELVDQPFIDRSKVRVSGPFTVEGVIPAEESIDDEEPEESPIAGAPETLQTFSEGGSPVETESQNAEAYLDRMIRLLREDGVRFPDNKVMKFGTLEALADGSILHAKGAWGEGEDERQVAVMFGPQYGPLIAPMVEDGIRIAARRGFDDLVFAAFSFDGAAQAAIQEDPDPKLRIHMAQIRPDVNMGDLLKTTVSSQLFTVSGSPRTRVEKQEDGQFIVHMEGVDIYDPVTNAVRSTGAEKVAAWFLDSDYDGRCFCVCQAFFPDKSAWEKIGKALGGTLDADALAKLSGTVSLPFPLGPHKRIAVKVIDPRGNEVMRVHRLGVAYD